MLTYMRKFAATVALGLSLSGAAHADTRSGIIGIMGNDATTCSCADTSPRGTGRTESQCASEAINRS